MSDKPEEPNFEAHEEELDLTPLDVDAFQMYELHNSLLRAGFKGKQALQLVAMIVNDAELYYSVDVDGDEEDGEEPHGAR